MHGPSASLESPWREYPVITVIDSVLRTLPTRAQKRAWKKRRNFALNQWAQTGMVFDVRKRRDAPVYDTNDPNYPRWNPDFDPNDPSTWHMVGDEDAFMRGLLVPGCAHLLPMAENWAGGGVPGMGWMFETGSFAIWNMPSFWLQGESRQKYIVTHEFGHALGLSHQRQRDGGNPASVMYVSDAGYMGSGIRPDAHDLTSLKEFYG